MKEGAVGRIRRLLVVAALAGSAGLALVPPPPVMAQATAGQLQGQLLIFFDPEKYRAWRNGSASAFAEATAVPAKLADVPFLVMLTVAGCKAGPDGKCNVTADYQLFGPDGMKVVDDPGRKVWTKAAQPANVSAFSEEPVPAMLQSSDPRGAYRLHIVLHDNIAQVTTELERTLTLEPRP